MIRLNYFEDRLLGYYVAALTAALNSNDNRAEAAEMIRSMIEEIRLVPDGGKLAIELHGDLAMLLSAGLQGKDTGLSGAAIAQIELVAGAGFEPAAFRL